MREKRHGFKLSKVIKNKMRANMKITTLETLKLKVKETISFYLLSLDVIITLNNDMRLKDICFVLEN